MAIDTQAERQRFEEAVYGAYFLGNVQKGGTGAALTLRASMVDKAEFCRLDHNGEYVADGLQPAWVAWQLRADIDASGDFFDIIEDTQRALAAHQEAMRNLNEVVHGNLTQLANSLYVLVASVRGLPPTEELGAVNTGPALVLALDQQQLDVLRKIFEEGAWKLIGNSFTIEQERAADAVAAMLQIPDWDPLVDENNPPWAGDQGGLAKAPE